MVLNGQVSQVVIGLCAEPLGLGDNCRLNRYLTAIYDRNSEDILRAI